MFLFLLLGIFVGGGMPILLSFPMLLPEIGPVYAGTAGGFIATLQLFGAVFIPSFILAPLAGDNYTVLFILASISLFLATIVSTVLPELGLKTRSNTQVSNN
jgi:NNP family nitrate/nitrite transporter-like MFS transporter